MNTQQAFLTTCFEYVQTDSGMDFAKLWLFQPADRLHDSRFLGRTDQMSRDEALEIAARIAGPGVDIASSRSALAEPTPAEQFYMRAGRRAS